MRSAGSRLDIAQAVKAILEQRSAAKRGLLVPTARPVSNLAGIAMLSLAPAAVTAVGLGDIQSQSSLGEPLRASVPLSLASGESVRPGCITVPPKQQSDLRGPANATVNTPLASGPGVLQLGVSTTRPLYEPMYELTLRVDCPGIPTVLRHYVLMLDLPGMGAATQAATQNEPARAPLAVPATAASATALPQRRPAPTRGRSLVRSGEAIAAGSKYRVREGDTLSTIAARIEGRPADSTWALSDWIFKANPDAFIRNNKDLIKLGTLIIVPGTADWNNTSTPSTRAEKITAAAPLVPPRSPVPARTTPATATAREVENQMVKPATPVMTVMPTELVTTPRVVGDSPAGEMTVAATPASPFADEIPTSEAAEVSQAVEPPPPVVLTQRQATQVSPLLAVLLGVFLGFGLSILLLRARLLEGLSSLFARGRGEAVQSPTEGNYDDTDEWLKTSEDRSLDAAPVSLGTPAEETYVVEVDKAGNTVEVTDPTDDTTDTAAPDDNSLDSLDPAVQTAGFAAPFADVPGADAPELAELFADDLADLSAEPDLPGEIFADAGEDDVNSLAPTAEMPKFSHAGSVLDPTLESTTPELGALPTDTGEIADLDMQGFADTQGDETKLSDTLQEALSLLEQDFENELTASQIIDQSAIKRALEDGPQEDADEFEPAPQKRAS